MNKDIEEALVKAEQVKGRVNEFIENDLPNLTISSDATELIAKLFESIILMMDAAVDAIIIIERVHEVSRGENPEN